MTDAQAKNDIDNLLDGSFTSAARKEAFHILKNDLTESSSNRLFTLFLQRDDMNSFLDEFQELQSALGNPDAEDKFNWSRFSMATPDDEYELEEQAKMEEFHEKNKEQLALSASFRQYMAKDDDEEEDTDEDSGENSGSSIGSKGDVGSKAGEEDEEDEIEKFRRIREPDEDGVRQKKYAKRNVKIRQTDGNDIDLEDVDSLTDKDGHTWGGFVVDTDVVQKVTPGNRIMRYRTLVVVGNLRGSCGFGVGKAEEIQMATKYAFRYYYDSII